MLALRNIGIGQSVNDFFLHLVVIKSTSWSGKKVGPGFDRDP